MRAKNNFRYRKRFRLDFLPLNLVGKYIKTERECCELRFLSAPPYFRLLSRSYQEFKSTNRQYGVCVTAKFSSHYTARTINIQRRCCTPRIQPTGCLCIFFNSLLPQMKNVNIGFLLYTDICILGNTCGQVYTCSRSQRAFDIEKRKISFYEEAKNFLSNYEKFVMIVFRNQRDIASETDMNF